MNFLLSKELPTFNFLTLGRRGVGKTVFFAGCYAEVNNGFFTQRKDQSLWFEGQNPQDKEHLDSLLNYVAKTGEYPPATLKITEFNLDLKRRDPWGKKTLCHFRWYDIPGEYCNFERPDYQQMVLKSHSCYVFLNAAHLIHGSTYLESLDSVLKQVISIANLKSNTTTEYTFALIFTQFDRLPNQNIGRLQIEETIRPFLITLEEKGIKYLRFYSEVPIVKVENHYKLKPKGTAVSLIWVVSELQEASSKTLKTSQQKDISPIQHFLILAQKYRKWLIATGISGVVLVCGIGLVTHLNQVSLNVPGTLTAEAQIRQYQLVLQDNPRDLKTLVALSELYIAQGQLKQAISVIETITQQQPNHLDWQFNLAKLYELVQENPKAEEVYDRILAQDNQHFYALLGKGLLRQKDGDLQTAQFLFKQAEQVAPTKDLKAQVRNLIVSP